jgi:hypothetical protein
VDNPLIVLRDGPPVTFVIDKGVEQNVFVAIRIADAYMDSAMTFAVSSQTSSETLVWIVLSLIAIIYTF